MNRLYSIVLILLTSLTGWSQVTTWTGGAHDGSWTSSLNWDHAVPTATTIARFDNGTALTISNVPNGTIGGLVIANNTQLSLLRNNTGVLTIANSNASATPDLLIDNEGNSQLMISNNLSVVLAADASADIYGTLVINNGAIYHTGNAGSMTTVKGRIINVGTINSNSNLQLVFAAGAKYEHERTGGNIPLATWDKQSDCIITGVTNTVPTGLNQVFGNYEWNCPAQTGGLSLGVAIPVEIRGNLVIEKTGAVVDKDIFIQLPAGTVRVNGDFIVNQAVIDVVSATTTINLSGNFIMKGGAIRANGIFNDATINLNFSGKLPQSFTKTGGSIERISALNNSGTINFTIQSTATVDFGTSVLNGAANFVMESGSVLITANPQGISATGNTGSVQVNGVRSYHSVADYIYNGATTQVTGLGLPAAVRRLVIDNGSGVDITGGVVLSRPTTIKEELVLMNGFLKTNASAILTVNDGGAATSYGNTFVAGPMQKIGNSAFKFPTGWAGLTGGYIPIEMGKLSSSATIQAEYKRATATTVGATINMPLHHVSYCEYWELFAISGAPTTKVGLHWNSHSNCNPVSYISNFPTLRVAHYNSGTLKAWTDAGNSGGSLANGLLLSKADISLDGSAGRFFTMASISSANSPLPVFFDDVVAYEDKGDVEIKWSNLTERDVATYFVERSVNGRDYAVIGQHLPKSNRDDKASYEQRDEEPADGSNFYRIKVIERASSKIIFSKVIRVEMGKKTQLALYPNPVTGKQLTVGLSAIKPGAYQLVIVNTTGQDIYRVSFHATGTSITQSIQLPATINPGMYRMIVRGDAYEDNQLFLVQ